MARYPLEQVIDIKKRRVEAAEKVLQAKKQALAKEEEKLREREKERDGVKKHHADKLQQLRDTMDHETTTPKIAQMKLYLKLVKEKLAGEEKKVEEQKAQVKIAQKNVEDAKEQLRLRELEVDKLKTHKESWIKEARKEQELEEAKELDEIGTVLFNTRRLRSKA